jgi:hypothetical protein
MRSFPDRWARRRRADTDATVMALSGLVIALILLLAFVSGLALWQWRQAAGLRAQIAPAASTSSGIAANGSNGSGSATAEEEDKATQQARHVSTVLPLLDAKLELQETEPETMPPIPPDGQP